MVALDLDRLIYAAWMLLVVYLTVAAIGAKRDKQPHLGQSLGLTLAIVVAIVLPHLKTFQFVNFAPVNPLLGAVGLALTLGGMAFLIWGRQTLGANWSQTVSAKEDHELVTTGPYRYVRHPMYTGGIIACLGSAIAAGGVFVFLLLILTPLFLWRVSAEDALMTRQFPREFPDYKKRTYALIPFVW
jgi:protein-S-isoprenylcysteine O-methyltransferase Ste14